MSKFPFKSALNASTLRPFGLTVGEQIEAASAAGFQGIEVWVRDVQAHLAGGGSVRDLSMRAKENRMEVINGIAFFKWTDADPKVREAALEQARREMELLERLGCKAVTAPPTGDVASLSLEQIAEHFVVLHKLGREIGVTPILEFWGRSPVLNSVAEARTVLEHSGIGRAAMLLDLFHMYIGDSSVSDVESLPGSRVGLVHISDYRTKPGRKDIQDGDRVMPGDGVGPVSALYHALHEIGYSGYLSVELFRLEYEAETPEELGKEALGKMVDVWKKS